MTKKTMQADEAVAAGLDPFDVMLTPITVPALPSKEPRALTADVDEPPDFTDEEFERHMLMTDGPRKPGEWQKEFVEGRDGIKGTIGNALLILRNDPALRELFQKNLFSGGVELAFEPPWPDEQVTWPRPINDNDYTRFIDYSEKAYDGVVFRSSIVGDAIASHAAHTFYDPLHDWLTGLRWDGTPRLTQWLTTYLGVVDNAYTRAVSRSFCIGAVARALKPGCKVDTTMVLEGNQGTGKSTALRVLVGDRWFLDHLPDFNRPADVAQALAKAWVHELSELATLSRAEVEKIKQFLVQLHDAYRPPYGRVTIEQLRRCVFAATTNRNDYLRDSTGNRRFLPIRTGVIDMEALARDREQLWAEAVAAFLGGEPWHIRDTSVLELARTEQAERLDQDAWLGDIEHQIVGKSEVLVADLLGKLGVETGKRTSREAERVKSVLRLLGWEEHRPRANGIRQRVWRRAGVELPLSDLPADDDWPA